MEPKIYESNYFLRFLHLDINPFTPNILIIDKDHIEFKRRNWYLISVDSENLNFQRITGVTVNKHIFGATITIKSTGSDPIIVRGYWKNTADEIKKLCATSISSSTSKGGGSTQKSVSDEIRDLKSLLDDGVLTEEEYQNQKAKILNG